MNSLIEVTQTVLFTPARLLAQVESSTEGTAPSPFATIIGLLIALVLIVAMWKVFTKAGQPGWASIIPIYNIYIWCKIVGRPWWWILLMLIPLVNFIICIILLYRFGQKLRQRCGLRPWPRFFGNYFLPDSRVRQRAISRTYRREFGAGTAGCVTNFAKAEQRRPCPQKVERVVPNTLTGPNANRLGTIGSIFCALRLCYDFTQPGLRFSLKAAIPSRASSDSRACM